MIENAEKANPENTVQQEVLKQSKQQVGVYYIELYQGLFFLTI